MNFSKLHPYRFEIFFLSQFFILFGSILVSNSFFDLWLLPAMFFINIFAGLIMMSKKRLKFIVFLILIGISGFLLVYRLLTNEYEEEIVFLRMAINFLFYLFVTYEIVQQVWDAKKISSHVIFGLISGYVSIGLIGYFLCMTIELAVPGSFHASFKGAFSRDTFNDEFMYFSYITLLSIGYGDITPASTLAQKVSVLIGLIGQMYNVIITAIVVGKYINQLNQSKNKLEKE
ncbi:ion channel [Flavicella sp.]|uniref:ion channel n=1 Tax=Flavicella sp. TaxID=2957742 RepID=UPI0026272C00|nr:ion channel [Flavicella sp.]MDG1804960.1 ion channel [Flavicella sp.]